MTAGGRFEEVPRRAWWVLVVVSICSVLNPLGQSILNVAFPTLQQAFSGTSAATLSWVISLYAITSASTLIVGAVVADRFGAKRVLVLGAAGFNVASIVCGFAPTVAVLLIARVFQALFSSLVTPAGAALVLREFPASRSGTAIAAWAAGGSVATALGPTLGAFLVDLGGWRWTFWFNVPFGVVGMVLVAKFVRETPRRFVQFPDLVAVPLIMASISGVILGVSQSSRWGWGDVKTVGSITVGLLIAIVTIMRTRRHPRPLLDLSLFGYRSFRIANISSLIYGSAFFALFFGFPRFTHDVWKYDIRAGGLLFLPIPVAGALFNGPAGRFADARGHRRVMIAGGLLQIAGGLVLWTGLTADRNPALYLTGLGLVGLASSLTWPAIFGNTVLSLPIDRYAASTSVNQTAQRMATAAGAAIAVSLIGEAPVNGVGNYNRIFALAAIGGVMAVVIGSFMRSKPSVVREPALTS